MRHFTVASLLLVGVAIVSATVPYDLSNVHSKNVCPKDVLIVRPKTVDDIEEAGNVYALPIKFRRAACSVGVYALIAIFEI
eukprot:scaffold82355_cov48-Prasinocladus_malaysianus.AAC.1